MLRIAQIAFFIKWKMAVINIFDGKVQRMDASACFSGSLSAYSCDFWVMSPYGLIFLNQALSSFPEFTLIK